MNKRGEIILVEDDSDDADFFKQAYRELGIQNKLTIFSNGKMAYDYFNNTDKNLFIIICDINMPVMSGIELRDKMQQVGEWRLRAIPFLFLTTGIAEDHLINAYANSIQGFFLKPDSYAELKIKLKNIIDYWMGNTEPVFYPKQLQEN